MCAVFPSVLEAGCLQNKHHLPEVPQDSHSSGVGRGGLSSKQISDGGAYLLLDFECMLSIQRSKNLELLVHR